ncbi:unnamed protein product [Amoebophrya sp. A25]|nr:unnamed protein product [Amoebophrya sp. A25]|eukprot:GSA25T00007599001.1
MDSNASSPVTAAAAPGEEKPEEPAFDEGFLNKFVQNRDEVANHVQLGEHAEDGALNLGGDDSDESDAESDEDEILNIERKLCLFQTPTIQLTLLKFWKTLLASTPRAGEVRSPQANAAVSSRTIGMDTFLEFNILLQRVLLQEQKLDLSTARASAVTDWIESTNVADEPSSSCGSSATQTDESSAESMKDEPCGSSIPIAERRMRLDQFALFLFDLTVIWCHLSYSSFLFFLGVVFLHTTRSEGLTTKEFRLRDVDSVKPLPPLFFELAADDFEFVAPPTAPADGANTPLSTSTSRVLEPASPWAGTSPRGADASTLPALASTTSTSFLRGGRPGGAYPTQSAKRTGGSRSPSKPAARAAPPSTRPGQRSVGPTGAFPSSSSTSAAAMAAADQLYQTSRSHQESHHSSSVDRLAGRPGMSPSKVLDDEDDEGKQFEKWYRVNFETEAETLLFVQRQMFEVTRDMRAVFLFPAQKVSNRDRILQLLEAAKRLQGDLSKVTPIKASALLSTVERRKGSLSPLRQLNASSSKAAHSLSPSMGLGLVGAGGASSSTAIPDLARSTEQHQQRPSYGLGRGGAAGSVLVCGHAGQAGPIGRQLHPVLPRSLRGARGSLDHHPIFEQTEDGGMYFKQKRKRPDKYLVVGKLDAFRSRGRGNLNRNMLNTSRSAAHGFSMTTMQGGARATNRDSLFETEGLGWRHAVRQGQAPNDLPCGIPQRIGSPQYRSPERFLQSAQTSSYQEPGEKSASRQSSLSPRTSTGGGARRQPGVTSHASRDGVEAACSRNTVGASTLGNSPRDVRPPRTVGDLASQLDNLDDADWERSREFITRFEAYLKEQNAIDEQLPAYDLPIRIPEVYSNQLKPWLATQANDILYWVRGQEETIMEKTRKFQSIKGLPGPMATPTAQVWQDMRSRLARILFRGNQRADKRTKRKANRRRRRARATPGQSGTTGTTAATGLSQSLPGREFASFMGSKLEGARYRLSENDAELQSTQLPTSTEGLPKVFWAKPQ